MDGRYSVFNTSASRKVNDQKGYIQPKEKMDYINFCTVINTVYVLTKKWKDHIKLYF